MGLPFTRPISPCLWNRRWPFTLFRFSILLLLKSCFRMGIGLPSVIYPLSLSIRQATPGSVCFLVEGEGKQLLLSGDTLFAQSVGRTDLPGGDGAKLLSSLRRLAELPDDLLVLPGHGPKTTIGDERKGNPFWPR